MVIAPNEVFFATLLGIGDGTFRSQDEVISLGAIWPSSWLLVGEITGDQRPDLLIPGGDGRVTTLENTCE